MKKFTAQVIQGFQVGSKFGIATANLQITDQKLLEEGVYIVSVKLSDTTQKGGLLHWGNRKTFGSGFSAEVHILDFESDIYGKTIEIQVEKYLRPVKTFENSDALFTQIERDIQTGKKYFLRQKISEKWRASQHSDNFVSDAVLKISHHDVFLDTQDIMVYAPTSQEINFVQNICSKFSSKTYFFPRVKNGQMKFFESKYEDLKIGNFGILEPISEAKECDYTKKYLVFVPGQAFDKNGNRLGRGGGFYDTFLADLREKKVNFYATAVIPKFAYFSQIPTESHDEKVDELILV